MISFFKKYLPFARASFLDLLAYKFTIFCWLIVDILSILVSFFVWTAVFSSSSLSGGIPLDQVNINGFTYKEMISYVVIIFLFSVCVNTSNTMDSICNEVKDGSIAMQLIKPISYRIRFIFSSLGTLVSINLLMGLPLLIISYLVLSLCGFIPFLGVGNLLIRCGLFFVSEIIACLLTDSFNYIFGIFSFYTLASFGLFNIKNGIQNFLSGTLIPMTFMKNSSWGVVRSIGMVLDYSPFVYMAQYPTYILMGKIDYMTSVNSLLIALCWLLVFELIGHLLYSNAIKKVIIQGG
ncbi:MAG: ABC transporter permease [Bacilli bacterium]